MKVSSIPTANGREESVLTRHEESIVLINAALNIKKEDGYLYSRSLLTPDMPASIVEQELSCRGLLNSEPLVKQVTLADYFKFEDKLNTTLHVSSRFVPRGKPIHEDDVLPIKTKRLKKYYEAQLSTTDCENHAWTLKLYPKEVITMGIDEQFLGKQPVFRDLVVLETVQRAVHLSHKDSPVVEDKYSDDRLGFPPCGTEKDTVIVKGMSLAVTSLPMPPEEFTGYLLKTSDESVSHHFSTLFTNLTRVSVSGIYYTEFKRLNIEYRKRLEKNVGQIGSSSENWSRSELQWDFEQHQKLWQKETHQSVYCYQCNSVLSVSESEKCKCDTDSMPTPANEALSCVTLELTETDSGETPFNLRVILNDKTELFYSNLVGLSAAFEEATRSKKSTVASSSAKNKYGTFQLLQLLHAYFTRFKLLQSEALFMVFHTLDHFVSGPKSLTPESEVDFLDLINLADFDCDLGCFPIDKNPSPVGTSSGVTGCSGSSGYSPDSSVVAAVVEAGAYYESLCGTGTTSSPPVDNTADGEKIETSGFAEDPELAALLKDLEEDGDEPLISILMSGRGADSGRLPSDASSISDNDQHTVKASNPGVAVKSSSSSAAVPCTDATPTVTATVSGVSSATPSSFDSDFVTLMQRGRILAGCQFDLNLSSQLQNLAPGGKTREFVVNLMKMWLNFGRDNVLKLCRGYVPGVSLPCLHMVGPGAWTGPREENGRFHQVDVNLGPAVSQWFAIEGAHVKAFSNFMMHKYQVDVMAMNGKWFPSIQMLSEANVPFLHGFHRPGSVMSIQGSTLSWKRSLGFAQHLCWTVAYVDYNQISAAINKNNLVQSLALRGTVIMPEVPLQTLLHDVLQILRYMQSKVQPTAKVVVQKEKTLFLDQCKLSKFVLRQLLESPPLLSQLLLFLLRNVYRLIKLVEVARKCCKVKPSVDLTWMATHCCRSDCRQEIFECYVHCEMCGNVCLSCALKRCDRNRYQCEADWNGYFSEEVDNGVPIVERIGNYRQRHVENAVLCYKGFDGQTLEDKLAALQKLFSDMKEHLTAELHRASRDADKKEKNFRDDMSKVKKDVTKDMNQMFGLILAGQWK